MITKNYTSMLNIAQQEIARSPLHADFQVIVIEYAHGAFDRFLLPSPDFFSGDEVVSAVRANVTPEIKSIACMWSGGELDLPSYTLRVSLCDICEKNASAKILLRGEGSLILKEIKETLK